MPQRTDAALGNALAHLVEYPLAVLMFHEIRALLRVHVWHVVDDRSHLVLARDGSLICMLHLCTFAWGIRLVSQRKSAFGLKLPRTAAVPMSGAPSACSPLRFEECRRWSHVCTTPVNAMRIRRIGVVVRN